MKYNFNSNFKKGYINTSDEKFILFIKYFWIFRNIFTNNIEISSEIFLETKQIFIFLTV